MDQEIIVIFFHLERMDESRFAEICYQYSSRMKKERKTSWKIDNF
jgi:hypothetical protein